jgi:acyl phosphate:glycerol-3-phosphate acyltransferase
VPAYHRPVPETLLVVAGYVVGMLPTALLVGRRTGVDPTTTGSGNPGASNVYRTSGRTAGVLVLLGDLLKGAVAAGVGLAVGGRGLGLACGGAAVVGHVLPVTRLGRGGKGVATAAGMTVVVFPLHALVMAVVWAVVAKASRRASAASIAAAVTVPIAVAATGEPGRYVAGVALVGALVIVRHAANIRRLASGAEPALRADRP